MLVCFSVKIFHYAVCYCRCRSIKLICHKLYICAVSYKTKLEYHACT